MKHGIVNKLFSALAERCPEVSKWPESLHVCYDSYQGQNYKGNECDKLWKNAEKLLDFIPDHLIPFHDCFVAFRDALESVGCRDLDPFYPDAIKRFTESYDKLCQEPFNISYINKVHIFEEHVATFIQENGRSLFAYEEQVVEAAHSEFDKVFSRYRIKDIDSPDFLPKFLCAIHNFNAYHIWLLFLKPFL